MFLVYQKNEKADMEQVYRFKVALKLRRRLWRRIEVKGTQTLGDLDRIIREAFKYDMWDHLSEFFRGRVWRSEGLGEIHPGGGGSGDRKRIDSLGLSEGDKMEYVYDFGDDIQHIITLDKVMELDETAKYPHIVSQNKPKYRYCEVCEELGKKIVATWICVDCSNEEGRDVLLCDDCVMKEHEDHYSEEVLY
jgi:hypothetical protein